MDDSPGGSSLRHQIYTNYIHGLDWLFPARCAGCGKAGEHWCAKCRETIRILKYPLCAKCGKPIKRTGICEDCQRKAPSYEKARSWAYYEGRLRKALVGAKYRRNLALGLVFANAIERLLAEQDWKIDLLLPIPLAGERHMRRGYNQVNLFARPLSLGTRLSFSPKALERRVETASQVGLSIEERWRNVDGVFKAKAGLVKGKRILLLDDVMTTGATLSSAASALKKMGAQAVYALTIARTILGNDPAIAID